MLQEEGHFLIRGWSDKQKMLQEGGLDRRWGSNRLHVFIIIIGEGVRKSTNKSIYFEELIEGYNLVSVWGLKLK